MKLYYTLRNKLNLLFVPVILFALASCGSYQYSGYEADGIYGESRPGIWEQQEPRKEEVKPNSNNSYYKNLFAQQAQMVDEALESDIFTDVEDYSSNDGYDNYSEIGGDVVYVGGNAPWGDDPDSYSINIINNGFYGGFYSPWRYGYGFWGYRNPYFGGWYDPFWPGGFWGGYGPYAYGYGDPFWNFGFGFGFGFGHRYGYGRYYPPYFYHYNQYNYYNNRVAYNAGRRNSSDFYRNTGNRRSSYARSIRDIRNSRYSTDRSSRVQRGNSGDSRMYTRTTSRTGPTRAYRSGSSRGDTQGYSRSSQNSSNRSYRTSSPSRSNSSSTRSGSVRSSSSSSRSSGASRSSGSRSSRGGGRGNR